VDDAAAGDGNQGVCTLVNKELPSNGPFYVFGTSASGMTMGQSGYFYPVYTVESLANDADDGTGMMGAGSHSHTFEEYPGVTFYMPNSSMNHAEQSEPSGFRDYETSLGIDEDEMVLKGYVSGSGDGVNIRKMHNRTAIDFDNNRYTWEIQDDSTANVLVLTAI